MKKKIFALWAVLLLAATAHSQDFASVDAKVKTYPGAFATPAKLAERINTDFSAEQDKVRAAFTWIATHIHYDLKAYKEGSVIAFSYSSPEEKMRKEIQYRQKAAEKTLRSKKGVCQDYSSLFHVVCDGMGVKCLDIVGTSKAHPVQIGKMPQANDHEWNAVKVGDSWKLIDVTWASGSVDTQTGKFVSKFNDGYFFTEPEVFFLNHFPEDERLLMTAKTARQFADLPLYYGPYILGGYAFLAPLRGTVSGASLPFKIADFPGGQISYVITSEGRIHDIEPRKNGSRTEFEIPLTGKSRGYLTVYVNRESVVTYKIGK